MNADLIAAEARYNEAAERFSNSHRGTIEEVDAAMAEQVAWQSLMELRYVPEARVQTYMHGRPYRQATVVKLHEDGYVEVVVDGERGGTRVFASNLTLV